MTMTMSDPPTPPDPHDDPTDSNDASVVDVLPDPVAAVLLTRDEHEHLNELVMEALARRLLDVAEGSRHASDLSPHLSGRVVTLLAHPQFSPF